MPPLFSFRIVIAAAVAAMALAGAGSPARAAEDAGAGWPSTIVRLEERKPLTRYRLVAPGLVAKGQVTGPAGLRVHVTAAGEVAKVSLLESCGNADLDEAAMLAMRTMKFAPHLHHGVVTEVTLVVPIHVPKNLGMTRSNIR